MPSIKRLRLKSLEDLVIAAVSLQIPVINYIELDGYHVYFISPFPYSDTGIVYYYVSKNAVEARYVKYNKFTGSVSFSNGVQGDTRSTYIPILTIEEQNLFSTKDLLGKIDKKKKKKKKA
ncbi:MAG: hypothetical protein DRJ55_06470 [Thermoprotei archaeon]|nr:MAG: hypothetical protein DRJ55_06470 [Thermoprotei archaeon]HDJ97330.1 hypothetical protein [Thermofilum sp.]